MPLTLLDVAFWLPTATLPCYEGAIYAVVGVSAATGLPLGKLHADPGHFCVHTMADPDHRACLLDVLARFAVAAKAKKDPLGGVA